jgi:hypothetical protein
MTDKKKLTLGVKVHNKTIGIELILPTVGNATVPYQQATRRNVANLNVFA